MAKGANVDKLAAEFADELDILGVRVANLEKKADNVKITGEIRYNYADWDWDNGKEKYSDGWSALRSRIWVNGQINDDWTYTGMIENWQKFDDNKGNEKTEFRRAYVSGKLGGLNITAGRQNLYLVNGNYYDEIADGIVASYGKDVKLTAFYTKPTQQLLNYGVTECDIHGPVAQYVEFEKLYGVKLDAKLGIVDATAGYTVAKDGEYRNYYIKGDNISGLHDSFDVDDTKLWNVGVGFDVAKDVRLTADYMKADEEMNYDDDGFVVGLDYAGAKADEPGSFGVYGKYYDQSRYTFMAHTMNGYYSDVGFKGYMVGANYTFAKNIIGAVEYYDLESKEAADVDMDTIWAQLVFTF